MKKNHGSCLGYPWQAHKTFTLLTVAQGAKNVSLICMVERHLFFAGCDKVILLRGCNSCHERQRGLFWDIG